MQCFVLRKKCKDDHGRKAKKGWKALPKMTLRHTLTAPLTRNTFLFTLLGFSAPWITPRLSPQGTHSTPCVSQVPLHKGCVSPNFRTYILANPPRPGTPDPVRPAKQITRDKVFHFSPLHCTPIPPFLWIPGHACVTAILCNTCLAAGHKGLRSAWN